MSPDPVNSQKAENHFVLGGFSSVPECGFLQERNAFSGILSGRAFRKLRLSYGSAFTEEQLNKMSREDIISLMKTMREHYQKQETKIQILEEKTKELEFLNAMLSDRLTLAQRKQFGPSSEKYADGYTQLNLFNEAEQEADPDAPEPEMEEIHPSSYKRKKRSGKRRKIFPPLRQRK